MTDVLRNSMKRWVASFLLVDVALIGLMVFGCVTDLQMCGIVAGYAVPAFFPYFWLPLPGNAMSGVLVVIGTGFVVHSLLGLGIGWLVRDRALSLAVTFPAAVAVRAVLATVAFIVLQTIG